MERPHPIRAVRGLFGGLVSAAMDRQVRITVGLTFAAITLASVFYHLVEGWDPIDALYFSTVTIATVGYGDFTPQTNTGKLFTVGYVLVGIGLFVAAGASLADHVIRRARELDRAKTREQRARRRDGADGAGKQQ